MLTAEQVYEAVAKVATCGELGQMGKSSAWVDDIIDFSELAVELNKLIERCADAQ